MSDLFNQYAGQLSSLLKDNQFVIFTAPTGWGKSTRVPLMLLPEWKKIILCQPRRLAARNIAYWLAKQTNTPIGTLVGYKTRDEDERGPQTRLEVCTTGVELNRALDGIFQKNRLVILDEIHEWNLDMETLLALAKRAADKDSSLRFLLMSATLESEGLQRYLNNAPVVEVPSRIHPVEMNHAMPEEMVSIIRREAKKGERVLAFLPGKAEIASVAAELEDLAVPVLPLEASLSKEEQQKCFLPYPKGVVILATNVAETSITIDGITTVVDSGEERQVQIRGGISGLYLQPTAQSNCKQRAGRAGRTGPGKYFLCSEIRLEKRSASRSPEIKRIELDGLVLNLACRGIDATRLEFMHQPSAEALQSAKKTLEYLKLIDSYGLPTTLGRQVNTLPCSPRMGLMLLNAKEYGVTEEVALIVGCMTNEFLDNKNRAWQSFTRMDPSGAGERSDLLAYLDIVPKLKTIQTKPGKSRGQALKEVGVHIRSYLAAGAECANILEAAKEAGLYGKKQLNDIDRRQAVLNAILPAMADKLWVSTGYSWLSPLGDNFSYRQQNASSVAQGDCKAMLAFPKDIEVKNKYGELITIPLLVNVTYLTIDECRALYPTQITTTQSEYSRRYNLELDCMMAKEEVKLFNRVIAERNIPHLTAWKDSDAYEIASAMYSNMAYSDDTRYPVLARNRSLIKERRSQGSYLWQSYEVTALWEPILKRIKVNRLQDLTPAQWELFRLPD